MLRVILRKRTTGCNCKFSSKKERSQSPSIILIRWFWTRWIRLWNSSNKFTPSWPRDNFCLQSGFMRRYNKVIKLMLTSWIKMELKKSIMMVLISSGKMMRHLKKMVNQLWMLQLMVRAHLRNLWLSKVLPKSFLKNWNYNHTKALKLQILMSSPSKHLSLIWELKRRCQALIPTGILMDQFRNMVQLLISNPHLKDYMVSFLKVVELIMLLESILQTNLAIKLTLLQFKIELLSVI